MNIDISKIHDITFTNWSTIERQRVCWFVHKDGHIGVVSFALDKFDDALEYAFSEEIDAPD
jgi:hypothetical protein